MRKLEVKQGSHRVTEKLFFAGCKVGRRVQLSYSFRFSESMYDNPQPLGINGRDVSKLFGLSLTLLPSFKKEFPYVGIPHHNKSARFGYRCTDNQGEFELLTYCYDKGERMRFTVIGTFKVGDTVQLDIEVYRKKVRFAYSNNTTSYKTSVNEYLNVFWKFPSVYYFLDYYHGGDLPKPTDGVFYADRLTS